MVEREHRKGSALRTVNGPVDASVRVPGSKSISNRALVCAALASGTSTIRNLAPGDDTEAMIQALKVLGIGISRTDTSVEVNGCSGELAGGVRIDAQLAGTTSRFLTALSCLGHLPTTVTGGQPLLLRPMSDLHAALLGLGAEVRPLGTTGHLPVEVRRGGITGGRIPLRGDISSQFLSALMLIAPTLDGGLRLDLTSKLISRPYVEMTAHVMEAFGISGIVVGEESVTVPVGEYRATSYEVEPDASSASYPLAVAAIAGGRVMVEGLRRESLQGDIRILEILCSMGCVLEESKSGTGISRTSDLHGCELNMQDVSDLVPTVAAVAMFADSPTRIRGVGFIRAKESDRIGELVRAINALGGSAVEYSDGLEVFPSGDLPRNDIDIATRHDHRLAMAFSLIALRRQGVVLDDESVVSKSWPNWWSVRELICASAVN